CGKPGHVSQICQENISNGNNPITSADMDVTVNKETLQVLLSLLETKKEDESCDQMTFVSLREGEGPLYLPAERQIPKQEENTISEDVSMDEASLEDLLQYEDNKDKEDQEVLKKETSKPKIVPQENFKEVNKVKPRPLPRKKIVDDLSPKISNSLSDPRQAIVLSTNYLTVESLEPIIDLLDYYYEEKNSEIAYNISEIPQKIKD
ncbi:12150_t:CDS:2, partial [Gigaspora rosea]